MFFQNSFLNWFEGPEGVVIDYIQWKKQLILALKKRVHTVRCYWVIGFRPEFSDPMISVH